MPQPEPVDTLCRLIIDRASVTMGDDVTTHRETWDLSASTPIPELLTLMARHYLPGVAGYAGWRVYQDTGESGPGWTLGLIYTRDHLRQERYLCMASEYPHTIADLARRAPLVVVQAAYLCAGAARPALLTEVEAKPTYTRTEPIRSPADSDEATAHNWHTLRRLNALAAKRETPRRAWIREHILTAGLVEAELFAARHMGSVFGDLCPASMALAARDLLGIEGEPDDVFGALAPGQAALGVVASVFGAFEWGLPRALRHRQPPKRTIAYLEYLATQGYPLFPIEQFLAGHIDFAQLAALDQHAQEGTC